MVRKARQCEHIALEGCPVCGKVAEREATSAREGQCWVKGLSNKYQLEELLRTLNIDTQAES